MKSGSRSRLGTLLAMGSAGALAGHTVGYWIAYPGAEERHSVLHASGHGYMDLALGLALVAGLVALVAEFGFGFLDRRTTIAELHTAQLWTMLAAAQLLAFVCVELAERALNGIPAGTVVDEPAFWIGLPLQAVVAGAVALFMSLAREAGVALRRALGSIRDTGGESPSMSSPEPALVASWTGSAISLRGPPPLLN